jgi:hypothetical protein
VNVDQARGNLETILQVAQNDLPQEGGAEATIIEQAEAALQALTILEGKGSLDMQYEDSPEPVYPGTTAGDTEMSSGVVVLAAALEMEEGPKLPIVIFRFSRGDGTFYPDRSLILEPQQLNKLPTLVSQSVAGAFRYARKR